MFLSRRALIRLLGLAGAAGLWPALSRANEDPYDLPPFGQVRLLHLTDAHAQLRPIYYREPNVNLGIGPAWGQPPHRVGQALLEYFGLAPGGPAAYALTHLDFIAAAERFGVVGGFAHLKTLIDRLRAQAGEDRSLLLDGGDTWQGSGTAYWTKGQDMIGACNLLGVDVMTGHWEFTYGDETVIRNLAVFKGDFVAHNIEVREEALFAYRFADFPGFDPDRGLAFRPYVIRELKDAKIAIIGQAFPYTPIANPARFIPDWTFGIQEERLQHLIDRIRAQERPAVVVLLSHNGMDVDLKLAARVRGLDVILGGHTHDGVPAPILVKNPGGTTLVTNAGSNGKFVGVLDLRIQDGRLSAYRYRLLPVFANLIAPDQAMAKYIEQVRAPYAERLAEPLAVTEGLLYRRGNFSGTFDQLICDALRQVHDAQISLSPGFRWGTSLLPGQTITLEQVLNQTCITYPETYRRTLKGAEIKAILEDVADNLFNPDPYIQQGGDMVRVGGLDYVCDPTALLGERIQDLRLSDGTPLAPNKDYVVAGWATVGSQAPGEPIWETVATYLRDRKTLRIERLETPRLKNVKDNPGIADYLGQLL